MFVRYDSVKIIFIKFREKKKLTLITTKVKGRLFNTRLNVNEVVLKIL